MEEIFINHRDSYAINRKMIDCDYYRYLNGERDNQSIFRGDYMTQYTWAETTRNQLNQDL